MTTIALLSFLLLTDQSPSLREWLAGQQWKKRIILVYAPSGDSPELSEQRNLFAQDKAGMAERDLVVRELVSDQLSAADRTYLQRTLRAPDRGFQVMLIGKDGGVKIRQPSPLTQKKLFSTIDGMSMRQQEMKKQRRGP